MKNQIKSFLGKLFYNLFLLADKKHIEKYSYETAPYCGHYYNGHNGKYTQGSYHESCGGEYNKVFTWFVLCGCDSENGYTIRFFPFIITAKRFVFTLKNRLKIGYSINADKQLIVYCFYRKLDSKNNSLYSFNFSTKKSFNIKART